MELRGYQRPLSGFSLIELMLALCLSLILLSLLYDLFAGMEQTERYVQGLAIIQENGQLASYLFTKEIEQAGFAGCRKINANYPVHVQAVDVTKTATGMLDDNFLIKGYQANNLPPAEKNLAKKMLPDSAAISLQFMRSQTANLLDPIQKTNTLKVNNTALFKTGDTVLVADCLHADLTSLTAVNKSTIQTQAVLSDYPAGTQIGVWQQEWFYLGKTGRTNEAQQPVTALYLYLPKGRDEELIDNISAMHIEYGYLASNHTLHFTTAAQIKNSSDIKAVRILLLLNSSEPILRKPLALNFDGEPWLSTDKKLYRQWEIIINLPNR